MKLYECKKCSTLAGKGLLLEKDICDGDRCRKCGEVVKEYMQLEVDVITENIRQWAKDRKIIPNSTLEAQNLKLAEEFGELADSFRRGNERVTKDSIGDVYVVATILAGLLDKNIEELDNLQNEYYENKGNLKYSFMWLQSDIGDVAKAIVRNKQDKLVDSLGNIVNDLNAFCEWQNIDFKECLNLSWYEIKDRKGYLREDGVFVKESDLHTQEEVAELERSEQL